jgi:flavodoxin
MAEAMAGALESAGHRVELFDARGGAATRLASFEYIIVGSEPVGLGGKIPVSAAEFLAQAGTLAGKRSMAFVRRSGLGASRALSRLMSAMEAEGMLVNCAEVFAGAPDAAAAARAAPIERA